MITYKREFQTIDTEAKAYFLGLMYADGCISNKVKNYQKCIRLSLTDVQIINDLHKEFPFFHKEVFDFSKYNKNCQVQYGLRKTSKELFEDLSNNGIFERKSYENKIKLKIPDIPDNLIRHFVRGYFDGDGSISTPKTRPNGRRVEFCSVSEELIKEIRTYLVKNNIEFYNIREKNSSDQVLYVLEACKTETILKFYELLYKDSTIFLKRKWDRFQNYKLVKRKDANPDCILCNSSGTVSKRASRVTKESIILRYKCSNCNKMFSIPQAQIKSDELLENQEIDNQQPS